MSIFQTIGAAARRRKMVVFGVFLAIVIACGLVWLKLGVAYQAQVLLVADPGTSRSAASGLPTEPSSDIASLALIAKTDDVLLAAAKKVGSERVVPNAENRSRLVTKLRSAISVRQAGRFVLSISFSHTDPAIAAEFANAVASVLTVREAERSDQGTALFFGLQAKRLEQDGHNAASELERFNKSTGIYSIKDQRELLLQRASELDSLISSTRGSIESLKGQKEALTEQLRSLKPVAQSPLASSIVNRLGSREGAGSRGAGTSAEGRAFRADPPLLLVRVYQDSMVALFKVNSDLAGASNLERHLIGEVDKVQKELASLASNEAEFARLQRNLALTIEASEKYSKRKIEEQIKADLGRAQLSSVRIAQGANIPENPIIPLSLILLVGLVGGPILGLLAALTLEALATKERDDEFAVVGPTPFDVHQFDGRPRTAKPSRERAHQT